MVTAPHGDVIVTKERKLIARGGSRPPGADSSDAWASVKPLVIRSARRVPARGG